MADADGSDKKGCCEKFCDGFRDFSHFLYNKENGQVLGRSGKSWAKIGFFYLIFYGFLAGFFSGMLAVFLTTLNDPDEGGAPKLTQFVENQPGLTRLGSLNFRTYNKTAGSTDITNYVKSIKAFLDKYDKTTTTKCPNTTAEEGMGEKECSFDTKWLGECVTPTDSLEKGEPCIYIKINKVYGWVPKSKDQSGFLKLVCNDNNKEISVLPKGFQISAFPFRGQKDFELPIVAVKFNATKFSQVDCYLDGKDIKLSDSWVPHRAYGRIRIN